MSRHDLSAYNNGCRCPECTEANTANGRRHQLVRVAKLARQPQLATHGVGSTYRNWGCRCPECTAANSADVREWRRRRKGA